MEKGIVEIDGQQFFTARWVMEQMSAQNLSIERAYRIALISVAISLLSIILSVAL